ncbi:MAG: STAS domain-containing protein [Melioribacteraceae bacterium]|nr:STAS domain-containing protein [Melioribacteraceae bacterium]MDD3559239.1 STAS domain-containing protein [Melioribacteraceae bacterium]
MKFSTSEVYNAAVISFKGKLMGGPDAENFHNKLVEFLESGKKNIVIDMSSVNYVNSTGIGNLIRGYTTVKNNGGHLKLAGLTDKIEGLLSITKLNSVFEQYATIDEAAKNF